MSQQRIQVEIKDKAKLEGAFLHFQKITTYLRKKCRRKLYFVKKSQRKNHNQK